MQVKTLSRLKRSLHIYYLRGGEEEISVIKRDQSAAHILPRGQVSLSKALQEIEKNCVIRLGRCPLPSNFWNFPRPTDPKASDRSAVSHEREEIW